jgi:hypothetical protein
VPVMECRVGDRPGWKYGDSGKCYDYSPGDEAASNEAKRKAHLQGAAEEAHGAKSMTIAEKSFEIKALDPLDTDAALTAINRFSRRPLTAEEVYIGRAALANDIYDKSGERFPVTYLQRFAETIVGAPVLEAHDKKRSGVGRWFGATVDKDAAGHSHLITDFYLDAKSDVARRVDLGIASEVSIGVSVPRLARTCDLCGKAYEGGCTHNVLEEYGGKTCTLTYGGDVRRVRAIEGSFVGVGCQHGAQVMRSKVWAPGGLLVDEPQGTSTEAVNRWLSGEPLDPQGDEMEKADLDRLIEKEKAPLEARVKALEAENADLQKNAGFHAYLLEEITKAYGVLKRDPAPMVKLLTHADIETLKEHRTGLLDEIDAKFPPSPVSKQLGEGGTEPPETGKKKAPLPFDPLASVKGAY